MPKPLDFDSLKDFEEPETPKQDRRPEPEVWPRREAVTSKQISVRMDVDTLARFQRLCREDRRTYGDMIRVLMEKANV